MRSMIFLILLPEFLFFVQDALQDLSKDYNLFLVEPHLYIETGRHIELASDTKCSITRN